MVRRTQRKLRRTERSASESDLFLAVSGYKAVRHRQELRIAPLTIIAGVNSSGKSSFIQPFLMMKQTLDSAFDPGALLLHGPNVKVSEYAQIFSRGKSRQDSVDRFTVELALGLDRRAVTFGMSGGTFKILMDAMTSDDVSLKVSDPLSAKQKAAIAGDYGKEAAHYVDLLSKRSTGESVTLDWEPSVTRNRCFLSPYLRFREVGGSGMAFEIPVAPDIDEDFVDLIRGIIHVPGLRGNPERAYPRSAVGHTFPGTFDTYVANKIFDWGEDQAPELSQLGADLEALGLTWKIVAQRVNDAAVELKVGRMPHAQQGGAHDLVSVADVGFGVSQTLPVLVALLTAQRNQIVYIEQPEIHLHPKAQLALADVLVRASRRGVKVIAETHSSLLIRGIQTAVARGEIPSHDVSLNWFGRDPQDGAQQISVAEVDAVGRFGDWPLDFDDVSQEADWEYLDAIGSSQ